MNQEAGCRCQKCNKKVGLWIGEAISEEATHYCLSQQNAAADDNIRLCEACYTANQDQYLKDYYNISKVEEGTTWIPVKKDGQIISWSYYKCLDCGNKVHPNDIPGNAWCGKCDSNQVEIFFGSDADEDYQGLHYTATRCSTCKKDKDITLHSAPTNNPKTNGKTRKEVEEWIRQSKKVGEICNCQIDKPVSPVSSKSVSRERERERESKSGFNWKSPWIIGGGIVILLVVVGIIIYFLTKKKEE